jgi:antitoxin component HigA of HigAB toxin-antitoxin module
LEGGSLSVPPKEAKPKNPASVSDRYFELVREFPLVPITSQSQNDAAAEVIHRLLQEELDGGGQAYLDVLSDLAATYEASLEAGDEPESPAERLRQFMELNHFTQVAFAKRTGIQQATVSDVLNAKRNFTTEQILSLSQCFKLRPGYFLGEPA